MAGTDDCVSRSSPFGVTVAMFIAVMRLVASRPETVDLLDSPSKSTASHQTLPVREETPAFTNDTGKHSLQSSANLIRNSLIHEKRNFAAGTGNDLVRRRTSSQDSNPNPENDVRLLLPGAWKSWNIGVEWHLTAARRLLPSELTQGSDNRLNVAEEWVRFLDERENEMRRDGRGTEKTRALTDWIPQVTSGRLNPAEDQLDYSHGIASDGMDRTTARESDFAETWSPDKARIETARIPARAITLLQTILPLEANTTFVSTEKTIGSAKTIGVGQTLPRLSLDSINSSGKLPQLFRSLPKAIIIGVKKCGTRALLEFLRAHPEVRATGPETHFFDKNYDLGLDWYRRQMPLSRPDQMTIEKTPSYFVTADVPERIFRMSNDTKLLVVVRDPVTRAVSHYTQVITKRSNIPSFERLAFSNHSNSSSSSSSVEINASWGALQIGLYAKHLETWLRFFPLDRMHFVSGEGLISDPAMELEKVQDFLGLRRAVTRDQFFFSSAKKGFPCLRKPSVVSPLHQRLHCLGKNKGRSHPTVDAGLLDSLRRFFRPHNELFYRMTKIDFGWP